MLLLLCTTFLTSCLGTQLPPGSSGHSKSPITITVDPCDLHVRSPACQGLYQNPEAYHRRVFLESLFRLQDLFHKNGVSWPSMYDDLEQFVDVFRHGHKQRGKLSTEAEINQGSPEGPLTEEEEIVGHVTGNGSGGTNVSGKRSGTLSSSSGEEAEEGRGDSGITDKNNDPEPPNLSDGAHGNAQDPNQASSLAPSEDLAPSTANVNNEGMPGRSSASLIPGSESDPSPASTDGSLIPEDPDQTPVDGLSQEMRQRLFDMLVAGPSSMDATPAVDAEEMIRQVERAIRARDFYETGKAMNAIIEAMESETTIGDILKARKHIINDILHGDAYYSDDSGSNFYVTESTPVTGEEPFNDLRNTSELSTSTDIPIELNDGLEPQEAGPFDPAGEIGYNEPPGGMQQYNGPSSSQSRMGIQRNALLAGLPPEEIGTTSINDLGDNDEHSLYSPEVSDDTDSLMGPRKASNNPNLSGFDAGGSPLSTRERFGQRLRHNHADPTKQSSQLLDDENDGDVESGPDNESSRTLEKTKTSRRNRLAPRRHSERPVSSDETSSERIPSQRHQKRRKRPPSKGIGRDQNPARGQRPGQPRMSGTNGMNGKRQGSTPIRNQNKRRQAPRPIRRTTPVSKGSAGGSQGLDPASGKRSSWRAGVSQGPGLVNSVLSAGIPIAGGVVAGLGGVGTHAVAGVAALGFSTGRSVAGSDPGRSAKEGQERETPDVSRVGTRKDRLGGTNQSLSHLNRSDQSNHVLQHQHSLGSPRADDTMRNLGELNSPKTRIVYGRGHSNSRTFGDINESQMSSSSPQQRNRTSPRSGESRKQPTWGTKSVSVHVDSGSSSERPLQLDDQTQSRRVLPPVPGGSPSSSSCRSGESGNVCLDSARSRDVRQNSGRGGFQFELHRRGRGPDAAWYLEPVPYQQKEAKRCVVLFARSPEKEPVLVSSICQWSE